MEHVRDLKLQSWRLSRDLADLVARARFAASPRRARDVVALVRSVLGRSDDLIVRAISLPSGDRATVIEVVPRGPRDALTETARWNIALIRHRLRDPNLRVRRYTIGARSQTDVYVLYLADVVNRTALSELRRRLERIDVDGILDSGMLEQFLESRRWTPFPQRGKTERPDVAAAALLEGRLCLVVDNSPLAMLAPTTLDGLFHSPALYVSVVSFHPDLLPVRAVIKIAGSREGVALPVIAEALLMQLFLEILREAGFRLPGPLGQTFGIVGGLVLSKLGVRAGLVSEMMVVTIALTGIASFGIPSLILGTFIRLLGLPLMLLSAVFGLYGLVLGSARSWRTLRR